MQTTFRSTSVSVFSTTETRRGRGACAKGRAAVIPRACFGKAAAVERRPWSDKNAVSVVALALTAVVTSAGCEGKTPTPTGASPAPGASYLDSSAEARAILQRFRVGPTSPLQPGLADRFQRVDRGLRPQFPDTATSPSARMTLPALATAPLHVEDLATGVAVDVTLKGARAVDAIAADGYLVFPAAHMSNAAVLYRPQLEGAEDFVAFDVRPAATEIQYLIALGKGARGLRLVERTLEVVDDGGAPRLRVSPPTIVGADGAEVSAVLAVDDCAVDKSPAAPWGRKVTAPGAERCTLRVSWPGEGVVYPAVLDPKWTTTGSMTTARQEHTATYLPYGSNLNGQVLVAGGRASGATTALTSAELYNRNTRTWAATGSMAGARRLHSAVYLATSVKVLVAGGISGSTSLNTAEFYSPNTGTWAAATNLNAARHSHTATVFPISP